MIELARAGKYDNVAFSPRDRRVMAQTGDVANGNMEETLTCRAAGTGGSHVLTCRQEFSKVCRTARAQHCGRTGPRVRTANKPFFINFKKNVPS